MSIAMTPTIAFTFPDASQAADFFAAIAEAFAKLAKRAPHSLVVPQGTTFQVPPGSGFSIGPTPPSVEVPTGSTLRVADPVAASPGDAGLKEFLAEQPPLSSVPSVPDPTTATEKKTRRKRGDYAKPVEPTAPATPAEAASNVVPLNAPAAEVTIEQLREAGNAAMAAKGGAVVAQVLTAFKAAKYLDVAKDRWPELLAALRAAA